VNLFDDVRKSATFSTCKRYRYSLTRIWGEGLLAGFIMLNPSTADGETDDPTIRACTAFTRRWGLSGFVVANLWPLRATDPADLAAATMDERCGPVEADLTKIFAPLSRYERFIAAWGTHDICGIDARITAVKGFAFNANRKLHCVGWCSDGNPRHPLYVKRSADVSVWYDPAEGTELL